MVKGQQPVFGITRLAVLRAINKGKADTTPDLLRYLHAVIGETQYRGTIHKALKLYEEKGLLEEYSGQNERGRWVVKYRLTEAGVKQLTADESVIMRLFA